MNFSDHSSLPMDFHFNPEVQTPWQRLLETGKGMVAHFAAAPDAAALQDARLMLAQFAVASSRQPVPPEHRVQWTVDIHQVMEDMSTAISSRNLVLTGCLPSL